MRSKPCQELKSSAVFFLSFAVQLIFVLAITSNTYSASSGSGTKSSKATTSSSASTAKTASPAVSAPAGASPVPAIGLAASTSGGSGTVTPDLFTGTLNYSIPIKVAPGRKGMAPSLALAYRSTGGNGWLGVGWDLEVGAIERSTKNGVDYSGDDFVLNMAGATIDLVHISTNEFGNTVTDEYRTKIENGFSRIRKISSTNGTYWEVTDRSGTKYRYGYTSASRQDDPADANKVFKWCLDYGEDISGNCLTISYDKTPFGTLHKDNGDIYVKQIDYTGNRIKGDAPKNSVHFYLEPRADASARYTTRFGVKTAYRLKTIEVRGSTNLMRAYKLTYTGSYSTTRSVLNAVQQFGSDAVVDSTEGSATYGAITNESTATKLPRIQLAPDWSSNKVEEQAWTSNGSSWGGAAHTWVGDFDGDGKTEIATAINGTIYVKRSAASFTEETWMTTATWGTTGYTWSGDFDGDGKTEIATASGGTIWVKRPVKDPATGQFSFVEENWTPSPAPNWGTSDFTWVGDFDGDGNMDIATASGGTIWVKRAVKDSSTGRFSFVEENWTPSPAPNWGTKDFTWVGDFNGDGRMEIATASGGTIWVKRPVKDAATGRFSFVEENWTPSPTANWGPKEFTWVGDFDGDGNTDIATAIENVTAGQMTIWIKRSTGSSFVEEKWYNPAPVPSYGYLFQYTWVGDFNGDGKADLLTLWPDSTQWPYSNIMLWRSTGSAFRIEDMGPLLHWGTDFAGVGDFNGDGKADLATASGSTIWVKQSKPFPVDMVATIANGLGGTTSISYASATDFSNLVLPSPMQVVRAIVSNDGNTVSSSTLYDYFDGFYHIGERDFRGFNHVKVTGPAGPNNEQAVTETWFHQGNETEVISESAPDTDLINWANVETGYLKGKPYRTRVKDGHQAIYSESTTTYLADGAAPYFNPPVQIDAYSCEGAVGSCAADASAKHIKTVLTSDAIGNVFREDQYGDVSDSADNRTVVKSYASNNDLWILGVLTSETLYQGTYPGTDPVSANKVSKTAFYYDGVADCTVASTNQTSLTRGYPTRIVRWLDEINDPAVRMAYDDYGNLSCTRDANGNISTLIYDGSFTFPTKSTSPRVGTNPEGYATTTEYYGVDGVQAEVDLYGLYGQVKSVTDPNTAKTTISYDTLGRQTKTTAPDGTWMNWSYPALDTGPTNNTFGYVGQQHVRTDDPTGISTWTYFDGFGRTIMAQQTGPEKNIMTVVTQYNPTGTVLKTSLPFFYGTEARRWTAVSYDAMGRVLRVDNPDGSSLQNCYNNGITLSVDAEQHMKRETRNAAGRLTKLEEFLGTFASCSTDPGIPYASTTYEYDVRGKLLIVKDHALNKTEIHYDNLGRKDYMRDPDMGYWTYVYDPNGNLIKQTDAKGQIITFTYDVLNRLTKKHYPRVTFGPDVVYTYDAAPTAYPTIPTYPKGRLTTITDGSGTTTLFYDNMGRTTKTIKTISGTDYKTDFTYTLGRLTDVTYPDGSIVNYSYDGGGNLNQATDQSTNKAYVKYENFNALAQPGKATYGNGVTTTYQYDPTNNRLTDVTTLDPASQKLLSLTYAYSNAGNITNITDNIDSTRSQLFFYDGIYRLTQAQSIRYGTQSYAYNEIGNILSKEGVSYTYTDAGGAITKPHAVKSTSDGKTYTYDANGNMISNGVRSLTYDYDNMPRSVILNGVTTTFLYDGSGARIKKTTPSGTTLYIGKMYECNSTGCSKYIFVGDTRIAIKTPTDTLYYHQDHLGSSRVVTDSTGAKKEEVFYYPFGAAQADAGSLSVNHKYTSQELDAETGLYYYNARYYDPALGRFISPDTILPSPADPQTFNRYAYVRNNPLMYTDPSGHFHWRKILRTALKAFVSPLWVQKEFNDRLIMKYPALRIAEGVAAGFAGPGGSAAFAANMAYLNGGSLGDMIVSGTFAYMSSTMSDAMNDWKPVGFAERTGKLMVSSHIGGVFSAAQGGKYEKGAFMAGMGTFAEYMRADMIAQSKLDPDLNDTGISKGFKGDSFKLGGGRWIEGLLYDDQPISKLGGRQGGPGSIFGIPYSAGSIGDYVVEAFAGPHDFLNDKIGGWYNEMGNIDQSKLTGFSYYLREASSYANVALASPFVAASITPVYMYPMLTK